MSNTDFVFIYKNKEQAAGERDFGLLKYWFRSVEKNASWVHCIYFVTAGDIPAWLNLENEKVKVVLYDQFMPAGCEETENLNAITLNLHRIEGILEQFVVFESRSFFTRRVSEKSMYRKGYPTDSAILDIPCATFGKDIEPHVILNNAGIINEHFDKKSVMKKFKSLFYSRRYGVDGEINRQLKRLDAFPGFAIYPIPYAMLKSVYERIWNEQHRLLEACSKQLKPTKRDYDYHLMRAWNMCEGHFRPMKTKYFCCAELGIDDIDAIARVIRRRKFKVIGFTDATDEKDYEEVRDELQAAFAKLFPNPCSFEKEIAADAPEIISLKKPKLAKEAAKPAAEEAEAVPQAEAAEGQENGNPAEVAGAETEPEMTQKEYPEAAEFEGEEFEDDDDDFYELNGLVEENMGTKERAELIEKMRAGNRRKRRVKKS